MVAIYVLFDLIVDDKIIAQIYMYLFVANSYCKLVICNLAKTQT